MCTMIGEKIPLPASAKGGDRWFPADHVYLAYDHPTHAQLDHALGIDFVREIGGLQDRVAVELSLENARTLRDALSRAIDLAAAHEPLH